MSRSHFSFGLRILALALTIAWTVSPALRAEDPPFNPYLPYQPPIDVYFPPLPNSSPQTADECNAIQRSYDVQNSKIIKDHEDCLQRFKSQTHPVDPNNKGECSITACQPLHDAMMNAQRDAGSVAGLVSSCMQSFSKMQADKQRQQDQADQQKQQLDQSAAQRQVAADKQAAQAQQQDQVKHNNETAAEAAAARQARADAQAQDTARDLQKMNQDALDARTRDRARQMDALQKQRDAITMGSAQNSDNSQTQISRLDQQVLQNNTNPLGTANTTPPPSGDDYSAPASKPAPQQAPPSLLGATYNDPNVAPPGTQAPASQLGPFYEPKTSIKSPFSYGYTIAHYQCTGELQGRPKWVDLLSDTYGICREDSPNPNEPSFLTSAMDSQGFAQLQYVKQVCGEQYSYLRTGWYFEYEGRPESDRRDSAESSRQQFIHDRQAMGVKILSFPLSPAYGGKCD